MAEQTTYADSGVDIELGDDVSKMLYNAAKQTWVNRKGKLGEVIVPFDDFSGVRAINVSNLPFGTMMNIGFDGVGTKVKIAQMMRDHRTIARDLTAMVCDDAVVRGAEPVLMGTILDVNSLKNSGKPFTEEVRQLCEGYVNAARDANVAIVNGEVAELGEQVGGFGSEYFFSQFALGYISLHLRNSTNQHLRSVSKRMADLADYLRSEDSEFREKLFPKMHPKEKSLIRKFEKMRTLNYNWGAGVVWFAKKERMFTGREIQEGDYLVGLKENGFRSNGLSLVRRILEKNYGKSWHDPEARGFSDSEVSLARYVLTPSKIYSGAVVEMTGGYCGDVKVEVHGVAHITGGGIPGKLGRMLKPSGLGAVIDSAFEPPHIMKFIQELGKVEDREAYKTFNMGIGMVIATPDPDGVIEIAQKRGIGGQTIGYVCSNPGIRIRNMGANRGSSESFLSF